VEVTGKGLLSDCDLFMLYFPFASIALFGDIASSVIRARSRERSSIWPDAPDSSHASCISHTALSLFYH
jgi:hypothetical protein